MRAALDYKHYARKSMRPPHGHIQLTVKGMGTGDEAQLAHSSGIFSLNMKSLSLKKTKELTQFLKNIKSGEDRE